MKQKPTFFEFLRKIYNLSYEEYELLNDFQKKALELDYRSRYGTIRWW